MHLTFLIAHSDKPSREDVTASILASFEPTFN